MTGQVGGPSALLLTGFHRERTGDRMLTFLACPALFAVTPPAVALSVTYRSKISCDSALETEHRKSHFVLYVSLYLHRSVWFKTTTTTHTERNISSLHEFAPPFHCKQNTQSWPLSYASILNTDVRMFFFHTSCLWAQANPAGPCLLKEEWGRVERHMEGVQVHPYCFSQITISTTGFDMPAISGDCSTHIML